jgi:hypothetical protein
MNFGEVLGKEFNYLKTTNYDSATCSTSRVQKNNTFIAAFPQGSDVVPTAFLQ